MRDSGRQLRARHWGSKRSIKCLDDFALIRMLIEIGRSQFDPALQDEQRATVEEAQMVVTELLARLDSYRCTDCGKKREQVQKLVQRKVYL